MTTATGVIIAILVSTVAGLIIQNILLTSKNRALEKSIKDSEDQIKTLETELKNLRQNPEKTDQTSTPKADKKPSRKVDFTGVFFP